MKKTGLLLATLCGLLWINGAQANGNATYFGAKGGLMVTDVPGMDSAFNGGINLGTYYDSFGIEGELTTTLLNGDTDVPGLDWDITTFAVYLVHRRPGNNYLKIKGGYLKEDYKFNIGGLSIGGSDSGASFGIGAGFKLRGSATRLGHVEVEYTTVEQDINFFSIGLIF